MIELFGLLLIALVYGIYFYYWFKAIRISAPFYPTNKKTTATMLKEISKHDVKKVAELGAGDGRVAVALAKEGYEVTAIEFNPILVIFIYMRKFIGGHKNLKVVKKDFLKVDYSEFDAAFIYLYPKVMDRLAKKLYTEMHKGSILISNTFAFHNKKPYKTSENKIIVYRVE